MGVKLRIGALLSALVAACCNVLAYDVKVESPANTSQDVKVHFYVDAHNSMCPGKSYIRAFNGLRDMLGDINNPLEAGLRQRDIGKRVEINTGIAYLLGPKDIQPRLLTMKLSDISFEKVKDEKWDPEALVHSVLSNEKKSGMRNIVACVISNHPRLKQPHGRFYLDEENKISIYMLWFDPEVCTAGGLLNDYWSVKEWTQHLKTEIGPTANDVANGIVDTYYSLSTNEVAGLRSFRLDTKSRGVTMKHLLSLPQKRMWKTSVVFNGKSVSLAEDSVDLEPVNGVNTWSVEVVSPVGILYSLVDENTPIRYFCLDDNSQLMGEALDVVKTAKKYNLEIPSDIKDALEASKTPVLPEIIEKVKKDIETLKNQVLVAGKLHMLSTKSMEAKSCLVQIYNLLTQLDKFKNSETYRPTVQSNENRIEEISQTTDMGTDASDIEARIREIDSILVSLGENKKSLEALLADKDLEAYRTHILDEISENMVKAVKDGVKCLNYSLLKDFGSAARAAQTKDALDAVRDRVGEWVPMWPPMCEKCGKYPCECEAVPPAPPVCEKCDKDPCECEATPPPPIICEKCGKESCECCKDCNQFPCVCNLCPSCGKDPCECTSIWPILLIGAVLGFGIWKVACRPRTVAVVSYESASSAEGPSKAEMRRNQTVRMDEAVGCPIDMRVVCKYNSDSKSWEFVAMSPNKTVWIQTLGGDVKKKIGEMAVDMSEGTYQMFDNEFAMTPFGTVELAFV